MRLSFVASEKCVVGLQVMLGLGLSGCADGIPDTGIDTDSMADTSDTGKGCFDQEVEGEAPYYQDLILFEFDDETKRYDYGGIVYHSVSVPDTVFWDGQFFTYVVDASRGSSASCETMSVLSSTDGSEWAFKGTVSIEGISGGEMRPVDPSVIHDGKKLRMFFLGLTNSDDPHSDVYTAESGDGMNYSRTELSIRFDDRATDPDVVRFNDRYFMYYSRPGSNTVEFATGESYHFETLNGRAVAGCAFPSVVQGGENLDLYCQSGGKVFKTTSGDGHVFGDLQEVIEIGDYGLDTTYLNNSSAICEPDGCERPDLLANIVLNEEDSLLLE